METRPADCLGSCDDGDMEGFREEDWTIGSRKRVVEDGDIDFLLGAEKLGRQDRMAGRVSFFELAADGISAQVHDVLHLAPKHQVLGELIVLCVSPSKAKTRLQSRTLLPAPQLDLLVRVVGLLEGSVNVPYGKGGPIVFFPDFGHGALVDVKSKRKTRRGI